MNKNIALMALTGILTLASCGQNGSGSDTTAPTVTSFAANPTPATSGTSVTLSGVATDNAGGTGVKSVVLTSSNGGPTCTVTVESNGAFSCTVTAPSVATATSYTYSAVATDTAGNASSAATTTLVVNPAVVAPTSHTMTVSLTGVSSTTITIKDANGAIVAGYANGPVSNGDKIVLPSGVYTVSAGNVSGYTGPTPATQTVDLSAADAAAAFTYVATTTTTPNTSGVYYVDANGNMVEVPTADLSDPTKFVFNAWLENLMTNATGALEQRPNVSTALPTGAAETGVVPSATSITGTPIAPEQTEVAPSKTQNLAAAYVGYKAADGNTYPVVGAKVRWNIVGTADTVAGDNTPYYNNTTYNNSVIFGAADGGASDTNFGVTDAGSVSAAGRQADTLTNNGAATTNTVYPSMTAQYPLYNMTGVAGQNMSGYTWTTLFSPDDYASAKVVAVASVNGMEIDKQVLDKFFAPLPKLDITKKFFDDSDTGDNSTNVSAQVDGTVPAHGYVAMRVTLKNTGGSAQNINLNDVLSYGDAPYHIISSQVVGNRLVPTGAEVGNTTAADNTPQAGTVAVSILPTAAVDNALNTNSRIPLANPNSSLTLPVTNTGTGFNNAATPTTISLNKGETAVVEFLVTSAKAGTYCDLASVDSAYSPYFGAVYPAISDQACAIFTSPNFSVTKSFAQDTMETSATRTVGAPAKVYITVKNNGNQGGWFNNLKDYLTSSQSNTATTPTSTGNTATTGPVNGVNTYTVSAPSDSGAVVNNAGVIWTGPAASTNPATNPNGTFYLAPGESKVFTVDVAASQDGRYCDKASIAQGNTSYAQDTAESGEVCLTVVTPDLTKTNSTNFLKTGGSYVSTITLKNPSPFVPLNVNLWDELGYNKANGQYIDFASATYSINGGAPVPLQADGHKVATGLITIPAGGSAVLKVNNTIPMGAGGVFCDYARFSFTADGVAAGFKEACVSVLSSVALQTAFPDTTDPILNNNGATAAGFTTYTAALFNEKSSTEALKNQIVDVTFGGPRSLYDPTITSGVFNLPKNVTVYYDAAPELDPATGAVKSDYTHAGAVAVTDFAVTKNPNGLAGTERVTINQNIPQGAVVFVVFSDVSANLPVAAGLYHSAYQWKSTGVVSSNTYTGGATQPTTVAPR